MTMETLRLNCEREASIEMQNADSFTASFCQFLDSIESRLDQTLQNQAKTRKEAKQMAIRGSISATTARVEQLRRNLQVQRARRDDCASRQSPNKENQGNVHKEETQEAISWYNKVLGFHIEGGKGVKFTFRNINMRNPYAEYTFTICHEDDRYTLLACDPHFNETKELISELDKTNGLFKFVRTMREKFQEVASLGILPQSTNLHQESATISVSAPALSVSSARSETGD